MAYKLLLSLTIMQSIICKSFAIECFYCTSANNTACLDPSEYDPETQALVIPIIRCEDTRVHNVENYNFFCRKIVQTIYLKHHESQVRVTRGCGWIRNENPCYRVTSHDHMETACQCFSDYCNKAVPTLPATATILSLILSAFVYLLA